MNKINVFSRVLLLLLGLLHGGILFAAVPHHVALTYTLTRNGQLIAHVTEDFRQDGKRYEIISRTKGVGVFALLGERTLISRGEITKQGLKPLHFESQQSKKPAKNLINDFDWKKQQLQMQVKGELRTAKLTSGSQDMLSAMYQFMFSAPKGDLVRISVSNGKKLSEHTYGINRKLPDLKTPAGQFKPLLLTEADQKDGKRIFLAADQRYLAAKIEMHEDEAFLEQTLTQIQIE